MRRASRPGAPDLRRVNLVLPIGRVSVLPRRCLLSGEEAHCGQAGAGGGAAGGGAGHRVALSAEHTPRRNGAGAALVPIFARSSRQRSAPPRFAREQCNTLRLQRSRLTLQSQVGRCVHTPTCTLRACAAPIAPFTVHLSSSPPRPTSPAPLYSSRPPAPPMGGGRLPLRRRRWRRAPQSSLWRPPRPPHRRAAGSARGCRGICRARAGRRPWSATTRRRSHRAPARAPGPSSRPEGWPRWPAPCGPTLGPETAAAANAVRLPFDGRAPGCQPAGRGRPRSGVPGVR